MKKVEESISINRIPEEVFSFFNNRQNDKLWMASVIESEWLDKDEPTGIRRRGRMVMNAMGRREFNDEVNQFEPGRLVGHRSVSGPLVIHTACIADPEESGDGSRVSLTYEAERLPGGWLGKMTSPLTSGIIRRSFKADLAKLKAILEKKANADQK